MSSVEFSREDFSPMSWVDFTLLASKLWTYNFGAIVARLFNLAFYTSRRAETTGSWAKGNGIFNTDVSRKILLFIIIDVIEANK